MENQNEINETVVTEKNSKKGLIAKIIIVIVGAIAGFFGVKAYKNFKNKQHNDDTIENEVNSEETSNEE